MTARKPIPKFCLESRETRDSTAYPDWVEGDS
jgi:hypothetical protein